MMINLMQGSMKTVILRSQEHVRIDSILRLDHPQSSSIIRKMEEKEIIGPDDSRRVSISDEIKR